MYCTKTELNNVAQQVNEAYDRQVKAYNALVERVAKLEDQVSLVDKPTPKTTTTKK